MFDVVYWSDYEKDGGTKEQPYTAGPFDTESEAHKKADRLRRDGWEHVVVCVDEPESSEEEDETMDTIMKNRVDLYQGRDRQDRRFGYVHGEDGGFFFTWHDNLRDTLDSIEADEQDGPGGLTTKEVRAFLLDYLPATDLAREMWPAEDLED